jgi:polysaccharide export outer membrane protein
MGLPSPTLAAFAGAALIAGGCAGLGKYTWVDDYAEPPTPADAGYLITPGDVLNVVVFNQAGMSGRVRVRPDGKISLSFLNDVEVAGQAPAVVAQKLQARLKEYVNVPVVTVALEEMGKLELPILGEVSKPGVYQIESGSDVLHALALAGGLTEFAHKDRIFVLRKAPSQARIRFARDALERFEGRAGSFRLRAGDVVVVE